MQKLEHGQRFVHKGTTYIVRNYDEAKDYKSWWVREGEVDPAALDCYDMFGEAPPLDYPEALKWLYLVPEGASPCDLPPPRAFPKTPKTPTPTNSTPVTPTAAPDLATIVDIYVRTVYTYGVVSDEAYKVFLMLKDLRC